MTQNTRPIGFVEMTIPEKYLAAFQNDEWHFDEWQNDRSKMTHDKISNAICFRTNYLVT